MSIVRKTSLRAKGEDGMTFILSDETPDRYDDVISASGWKLSNFKKNPIALFNHNSDFPMGSWKNLRVEGGQLKGELVPAPEGTSARIDELRKLMEADILRAVSVGFRPIKAEPRKDSKNGGYLYTESELVETSLVSVPANPNALVTAKALNISDETMRMIFAEKGKEDVVKRAVIPGKDAKKPPVGKTKQMTPLSVRIEETQKRIVDLQDQLTKHLETVDDANPTEDATVITETLNDGIEKQQKQLETLKKAEARLAESAQAASTVIQRAPQQQATFGQNLLQPAMPVARPVPSFDARVFPEVAKKIIPFDYMVRAAVVNFKHKCQTGGNASAVDILKAEYGECDRTFHMYNVITRAASAPAMTSTSGWADTLVQTVIDSMIESLIPNSIYPKLASLGRRYTFGRNGTISIPARTVATSVGGAFVLQGNAIPVKQGAFSAVTITPKKMGVITTLTREMAEHSTPALESILRDALLQDTGVALDTVLTDATASSTTRPAGLKNGVSKVNASSATPILNAFVADIMGLISALTTNTSGNIRNPVFIMNPADVLKASLLQTTTGDFAFPSIRQDGSILGIPIIQSTVGTSDVMFLIDAADFATATGDAPRIDVSDQAVLHMEDTSPTAISAVATPNTVAAPIRSLYQTDTMAIRMIMDVNWVLVRTGTVQWTDTMTWN